MGDWWGDRWGEQVRGTGEGGQVGGDRWTQVGEQVRGTGEGNRWGTGGGDR